MDKSKLLSAQQAIKIQSNKKKFQQQILDKFLSFKDDQTFLNLNDDEAKQKYIDEKLSEQINLFNEISFRLNGSLGKLEWLADRNESIVVQFKTKPVFMGKTIDGKIYLNNEETLFLIENNTVICYYKQLQLSLQDAFDLMIKNEFEFERYMVYSYLLRFGYRVRRFESSQIRSDRKTDFENVARIVDQRVDEVKKDLKIEEEQTERMEEDYNEERFNEKSSIKRPMIEHFDNNDQQEVKKIKRTSKIVNQANFKLIPLDRFIDHSIDPTNELDFLKFIRFKKLNKTIQNSNWNELIDEYNRNKWNNNDMKLYKTSFVIEETTINELSNELQNDQIKDELTNNLNVDQQFYTDFLNDQSPAPLIRLNESLTNEQIQQRLANYGPKLDLNDCSSNDAWLNHSSINLEQQQSIHYDYDVYLPNNKKPKIPNKPDYYLKILNSSHYLNFPISEIFKLNAQIEDPKKLIFVYCRSNELNFYQFTDVDLVNC